MGDFARDTAHLTMLENGAYRMLLDHYYSTERPLPADAATLYRIARANSKGERSAVDRIVEAFFPVNGDGQRHNNRADIEIGKHEAQATINREIGKRGGRPRKTESVTDKKPNRLDDGNRNGLFPETEPEPNRNPNHSQSTTPLVPHSGNGKPKRRRQRLPATPFPDSFEVTEAMSAWAQDEGLPADRVMPVTREFAEFWRGDGRMKADWVATWRQNVLKVVGFGKR